MLALVTTWLVIFGLLIYVGIPLWIDDDDPPFCEHCRGRDETDIGMCDDCWREIGTGD